MEILNLLLYIGGIWVFAALAFFAWNLRGGSFEHADRLALLPLDDHWDESSQGLMGSSPEPGQERGEAK